MEKLLKRSEVREDRKWKLSDIISDDESFEVLFEEFKKEMPSISSYMGKLTEENALLCLLEESKLNIKAEYLYQYALMKKDEDTGCVKYQELASRVEMLVVEFSSICFFISPELSAFSLESLERMKKDEAYADYSMFIDGIIRYRKRMLSPEEEKLLANVSSFSRDFKNIFGMFDNTDIKFSPVKVDGEKTKLSHGIYSVLMQNTDRRVRKDAFESMFNAYKDYINTLAAIYAGNVKKNLFFAKTRKFESCLQSALFGENIDEKVYYTLLKSVNKSLKSLHKYVKLRKDALNVKQLHMYDMYVPITGEGSLALEYDEAFDLVEKALVPLGEDYLKVFSSAKTDGWIDVEENENKRSGAYSWGVFGVHPFVLLNHRKTTHSIFTIAHEMGHAMHSYYSNLKQPYPKAGYEIFVAEIASTVNEVLLIKYLLTIVTGEDKKYLLSYYLDMFRTTLFRQTMFAEFEAFAHKSAEENQPLSADRLCEFYYSLNKKYYGRSVKSDELIKYEWARIPHFYSAFYVYKYSTGIVCAVNIVKKILSGEADYKEKYLSFLSSGGSDYPQELLKIVDIDIASDAPFAVAREEFDETLAELSELIEVNNG